MTDSEQPLALRSAKEVAQRVLALIAVVSRAHEDVADQSRHWVEVNDLDQFFSDEERAFYWLPQKPSDRDVLNFSWRAEALVSLVWALGGLENFPPLDEQVDIWAIPCVQSAVDSPTAFVAGAELIGAAAIEEKESDLHHEHWRVRDAQLFGRAMPEELHPSVVYERRYGLSWLVGWGEDWDDVPTDT